MSHIKRDFERKLSQDLVNAITRNMSVFKEAGKSYELEMICSTIFIVHMTNMQFIKIILESFGKESALQVTNTLRSRILETFDSLDEELNKK